MSMKKIDQKPIPRFIQSFLDWLDVEQGLSSKTQENYSHYLKRFFFWLEKNNLNIKPKELTLEHISEYRLFLSRNLSLKKSTQNRYLVALRSLLVYFAEKNITSISSDRVKLAREKEERQINFLTLNQLKCLFEQPDTSLLNGLRDRAILETFFSTGLRIAELVALNREQISIKKITSNELEVAVLGKGGRVRTVYFSLRALKWLKKYLETRKDIHEALFIVCKKNGKCAERIAIRTVQEMFDKYAARAGVSSASVHTMRHSFATDMLSRGVDIRTLQEFLGHKNIAATQIYTHVTNKRLKEIHKKFHGGNTL